MHIAGGNALLHHGGILSRKRTRQLLPCQLREITVEIQHQDRDQHQHRTDERIKEELDRRVFFARATPDPDEKIHRQQHDFPENIEEEEVERNKDTEHAGDQQQKQNAVALYVLLDRPTGDHRQHANDSRQHHQWKADAVDAHEIVDVKRRYPRMGKSMLHVRFTKAELQSPIPWPSHPQDRNHHGHQCAEGDQTNKIFRLLWQQGDHDRGQGWQEDDQAYELSTIHL